MFIDELKLTENDVVVRLNDQDEYEVTLKTKKAARRIGRHLLYNGYSRISPDPSPFGLGVWLAEFNVPIRYSCTDPQFADLKQKNIIFLFDLNEGES